MRAALAMLLVAACYSPDHREWSNPDAAAEVTLTVAIMGGGQVTVDNVGTCTRDMCVFHVPMTSSVKLEASATNEDHPFAGWTMACSGKTASCSLPSVTANTQVGAKFQ